jgi:hypothetical protein
MSLMALKAGGGKGSLLSAQRRKPRVNHEFVLRLLGGALAGAETLLPLGIR